MSFIADRNAFSACCSLSKAVDVPRGLGACHRVYSFYTSLDRIRDMLAEAPHRLWLTRVNSKLFDDLIEYKKYGAKADQGKIFIKCFSYGQQESAAMWGLYSPTTYKAIRVTVPQTVMIGLLKSRCYDIRGNKNSKVMRKTVSMSISDIVYAAVKTNADDDERSNALYWNGVYSKPIKGLSGKKDCKFAAGLVKDIEWSFENESRLIVKTSNVRKSDHLGIELPADFIGRMRFTLSPWADVQEEEFVKNCLVKWLKAAGRKNVSAEDDFLFRSSVLKGALGVWAKRHGL